MKNERWTINNRELTNDNIKQMINNYKNINYKTKLNYHQTVINQLPTNILQLSKVCPMTI